MIFCLKTLARVLVLLLYSNALFSADWYAYVTTRNTLVPINLTTNTAETAISIPQANATNIAITPDALKAYISLNGSNTVLFVDLTTYSTQLITVGSLPFSVAITPDGTTAYY